MDGDSRQIVQKLLVLRCQDGDREAFAELVAHWDRKLLYYVRRLVRQEQDAWQILQEVWTHVWRRIGTLRDAESFPPWLFAIARNTVLSHHRQVWQELRNVPLTDTPEPVADAGEPIAEAAEEVHFGLSQLPLPDREILTLFFLRELSTQDIAEVLRIPRGTVKSRLFHAREKLREVLSQHRSRHD